LDCTSTADLAEESFMVGIKGQLSATAELILGHPIEGCRMTRRKFSIVSIQRTFSFRIQYQIRWTSRNVSFLFRDWYYVDRQNILGGAIRLWHQWQMQCLQSPGTPLFQKCVSSIVSGAGHL
jgi:hypothetical protein